MMTEREQSSDIEDIHDKGGVIEEHLIQTPEETSYTTEQHVRRSILSQSERQKLRIRRVQRMIYFLAHIIVIFTGIRLFLQIFHANPASPFFVFISIITAPFVTPFMNLFGPSEYAISISALLFAIPIYYLFAWIAATLVAFTMRRSASRRA